MAKTKKIENLEKTEDHSEETTDMIVMEKLQQLKEYTQSLDDKYESIRKEMDLIKKRLDEVLDKKKPKDSCRLF